MSGNPEVESVEGDSVEESVEAPVVETPSEEESKTYSAADVKKLRDEAARHRVEKQKEAQRVADLEAKLKEFEDAKLSAEERLNRDFEETKNLASQFRQKAMEADLKYQLALAAKDEGITDLRAAVKLADRELIETDENGNISNVSDILAALKSEYTSLFASAPSAPHTGVTNPAKSPSAKKYTREDISKMTPERRVELLNAGEFKHLL